MSRVSKNILFNLIGQVLIVALGFWGTRLVFRQLGDEALGILYFAIAIYAVLTPIIDLGISSTVVREVASHVDNDREYVVRLTRTSALLYWVSYALLGVAIWMATPWLVSHWISIRTMDVAVAVKALRVLALGLLLVLPRSLYSNLVRGVQRMEFNNLIDTSTIAFQQAGTILIVSHSGGLIEIADCYLASFLLSIVVYIVTAANFLPWRTFLPGFSADVIRQNSSFTSRMAAYSLLATIQLESDKVLVSRLVPVDLLGFYGVAQTVVVRLGRVTAAVTQAAFPNLSALFHSRNQAGLMREYRRLQDLVCYGMVPVFAALIFAARPMFTYLLNAQAAQILLLPTALLCLGWYMNGTLNIPSTVSLAVGRPDISVWQNVYALGVVNPVAVVLIWKWGLVGAGLSCVFYHLFAYSYGARRIASECLEMDPRDWYLHVLKILALASGTYGVAWLVFRLNSRSESSIILLTFAFGVASAAYLCGAYLSIGKELREGVEGWRSKMRGGVLRYTGSD